MPPTTEPAAGGVQDAPAQRPPAERRRPPRRPSAGPTVAASVGAFLAVLALLAWQMVNGRDPALGAGPQVAAPPQPPARRVLVRRVIVRRVVHRAAAPIAAAPAAVAPAPAPAPSAAPAPTPAPAPVVTRAS